MCNSKKMRKVTNGRITVGRKCGQSMQLMVSGLNVHIDLALCIYIGAYLICIDTEHLRTKFLGGMEHYAKF